MYNMDIPVYYESTNLISSSVTPGETHLLNNATTQYFRKYLFQKAFSVFKWDLPKEWNKDYFLYNLYSSGFIGIVDTPEFGVIPQRCGLAGYDVFYAPKRILVSNPALPGTREYTINVNCVLMKLQGDYTGIIDIVNYYAAKLALCASAIDADLFNSRLSYIFAAKNKGAAESFKKAYDKITSGSPMVVIDKELFDEDGNPTWQEFTQNLSSNYIASDLLSDMRKIEAMFDTDIGIPNANTDKRERLISDEVNANNAETATRAEVWLERLKDGCAQVKEMFGIDINVDWRANPNEQQSNSFDSGNV